MTKEQFHSCLEFGAVDLENQKKRIWDYKTGQDAYDWFMCARYLNDLLAYVEMEKVLAGNNENLTESLNVFLEKVHHKDDLSLNLDKWIALLMSTTRISGRRSPVFYELGSTLFGCIEGIQFIDNLMLSYQLPLLHSNMVHWLGVDNSLYLNAAAQQLHQIHQVMLYDDFNEVDESTDVFFAKGVSLLYALENASDFNKLLASNEIALFDYSFANKCDFTTTIGTGKVVNYITKEAFIEDLPSGKVCFTRSDKINHGEETSFYELLIGSEVTVAKFIAQQQETYKALASVLTAEQQQLFFRNSLKNIAWQPL